MFQRYYCPLSILSSGEWFLWRQQQDIEFFVLLFQTTRTWKKLYLYSPTHILATIFSPCRPYQLQATCPHFPRISIVSRSSNALHMDSAQTDSALSYDSRSLWRIIVSVSALHTFPVPLHQNLYPLLLGLPICPQSAQNIQVYLSSIYTAAFVNGCSIEVLHTLL